MSTKNYKNILVPIPMEAYNKLKYISESLQIPLPVVMQKIIDTPYFIKAIEDSFDVIVYLQKQDKNQGWAKRKIL